MLSLERQNELREAYRRANPGWRPATEVYADLVRGRLSGQARLLDLGCGRGADTFNRNRRSCRRPDFTKRGFILQRIIQLAYTSPSALITLPLAIQCRQHRRRQNNRGASA